MFALVLLAACVEHGQVPAEDPPLDPEPLPPRTSAIEAFSGCLTLEDFQASGTGPAWRAIDVAGLCSNCHGDGFESEDQAMFESIRRRRAVMERYFEVAGDRLVAASRIPVVASKLGEYALHPGFATDEGVAALDAWGAMATERARAGSCGAPTIERGR